MAVRRLYVHIPFCHRICPYCAFYKHLPGDTGVARFVDALIRELEHHASSSSLAPRSLYFGGGTPSFLNATQFSRLADALHRVLDLSALEEWTLEANPRTFDLRKAQLWRETGVTRVSLGVQSWQPDLLRLLGRDHSPADAERSFRLLREAGHSNLGIDLIFSLPGQTLASWNDDLHRSLALEPEHLSAYNLTYEEDTEFFRRRQRGEWRESEHRDARHFRHARRLLLRAGYEHYETSNYARPGFRSAHNSAYWRGEDYLGLGPGAVSTVGRHRWKNVPDTRAYCAAAERGAPPPRVEEEALSETDLHNERVALLLRTADGLPEETLDPGSRERARSLVDAGLLTLSGGCFRLAGRGRALADPVAAELFV